MNSLLHQLLLFTFGTMGFISSADRVQAPNIIIILADDQGFDDAGFRGRADLHTPNINRLAEESVVFSRFYTHSLCAPTRAALMTGRHYLRTGVSCVAQGRHNVHVDETMIAGVLQREGYHTAVFGKWHLGETEWGLPWGRGFNEGAILSTERIRAGGFYSHFEPVLWFPDRHYEKYDGQWSAEVLTEKAVNFIYRNQSRPYFMYLCYPLPHEPWHCPEQYKQKYLQAGQSEPYASLNGMLEQLDDQIGRVMQAVNSSPERDNTIILYLSDNGPINYTSNRLYGRNDRCYLTETEWMQRNPSGMRGLKGTVMENGIRNQLFMWCPARWNSKQISEPVHVTDLFPTIAELAGAAPDTALNLDGYSLLPSINGKDVIKRGFFETGWLYQPEYPWPLPVDSLLADDWLRDDPEKLRNPFDTVRCSYMEYPFVLLTESGRTELYNLETDPQQKTNLFRQHPDTAGRLLQRMLDTQQNISQEKNSFLLPAYLIGFISGEKEYVETQGCFRLRAAQVKSNSVVFNSLTSEIWIRLDVRRRGIYEVSLDFESSSSGLGLSIGNGDEVITAPLSENTNSIIGQLEFNTTGFCELRLNLLPPESGQVFNQGALIELSALYFKHKGEQPDE